MEAGKLLKKGLTRIIPGQSHLDVIGTGSQPNSGSVELLFCWSRKNRKSNLVHTYIHTYITLFDNAG